MDAVFREESRVLVAAAFPVTGRAGRSRDRDPALDPASGEQARTLLSPPPIPRPKE